MYAKIPIYRSNNGAKVGIFPLLALVLGTFVIHQALIVVLGLVSNRFLMKYQKLEFSRYCLLSLFQIVSTPCSPSK